MALRRCRDFGRAQGATHAPLIFDVCGWPRLLVGTGCVYPPAINGLEGDLCNAIVRDLQQRFDGCARKSRLGGLNNRTRKFLIACAFKHNNQAEVSSVARTGQLWHEGALIGSRRCTCGRAVRYATAGVERALEVGHWRSGTVKRVLEEGHWRKGTGGRALEEGHLR
eukprot:365076-Chlamydomonas_euryale.AAC.4